MTVTPQALWYNARMSDSIYTDGGVISGSDSTCSARCGPARYNSGVPVNRSGT